MALARKRYEEATQGRSPRLPLTSGNLERSLAGHVPPAGKPERLVSGSDDFTMFLWEAGNKTPLGRMTGHQQPVNHVCFSPNGQWFASASFDKSVKASRTGSGRESAGRHRDSRSLAALEWPDGTVCVGLPVSRGAGVHGGVVSRQPAPRIGIEGQHTQGLGHPYQETQRGPSGARRRGLCRGLGAGWLLRRLGG